MLAEVVFSVDAVRRAISELTKQPVHEHFIGYLALLEARRSATGPIKPAVITHFHNRYLRVASSDQYPYASPFRSKGYGHIGRLNRNVAGSYAPSSLRKDKPFAALVEIDPNKQYTLRENHSAIASKLLLYDTRLSAVAVAIFLFRDFSFSAENEAIPELLNLFRDRLALRADLKNENEDYDRLFSDGVDLFSNADLIAYGG